MRKSVAGDFVTRAIRRANVLCVEHLPQHTCCSREFKRSVIGPTRPVPLEDASTRHKGRFRKIIEGEGNDTPGPGHLGWSHSAEPTEFGRQKLYSRRPHLRMPPFDRSAA